MAKQKVKIDRPQSVQIDVVEGCEGHSLYINNHRIAGVKPWAGGQIVYSFSVNTEKLKEILNGKTHI